jgi:hypothetical protein
MPQYDPRPTALREPAPGVSSPLLLLFGVGPEIAAECAAIAADASLGLVKVKHLFAACATVQTSVPRRLMVIGAAHTKWWDRVILEEHVARVDASVRWVSETSSVSLARDVSEWALAASRPPRAAPTTGRVALAPRRIGGAPAAARAR